MKRIFALLLFLNVIQIFSSCEDNEAILSAQKGEITIYLLEGEETGDNEIENIKHWISTDEIDFYDYSTHIIYLKDTLAPGENQYDDFLWKRFALYANGKKCYEGVFWSLMFSSFPSAPSIDIPSIFYPKDVLRINKYYADTDENDRRNNEQLKAALIASGKYRGGIECALTDVQISDHSVSYTYTLKSHDSDNLFVLDPEKMGADLFHYYTNGVSLYNPETEKGYYSEQHEKPDVDWELSWFSPLMRNSSMTRTVVQKGFDYIPAGEYECRFVFPAHNHIEKRERYQEIDNVNGRIWLGDKVCKIEAEK